MPRVKNTVPASATQSVTTAPIHPTTVVTESVPEKTLKKVVVKRKKTAIADPPAVHAPPVADEIKTNLEILPVSVPAPIPIPLETKTPAPVVESPEEVTVSDKKQRSRRQVTKETFFNDFEGFSKLCDEELEDKKGLLKQLKQLKTDAFKLLKIKNLGDNRKNKGDNHSGFMKPVNISEDLANFIGVNIEEPITRVMITKKICQHIKDKDLQNPEDRRQIIPDPALRKLFSISDEDTEPLTYYGIQKRIQRHIFKLQPTVETVA